MSFTNFAFNNCAYVTSRVDEQILQHMIDTQAEFLMEVTDKTKADIKVFDRPSIRVEDY